MRIYEDFTRPQSTMKEKEEFVDSFYRDLSPEERKMILFLFDTHDELCGNGKVTKARVTITDDGEYLVKVKSFTVK